MIKVKFKKPRNPELPDNLYKKPLEDAIYHVVQTCDVEVENTEMELFGKKLKQEIKSIDNKIENIEKRLGGNLENFSEEIKILKSEIENVKTSKPFNLVLKVNGEKSKNLGFQHFQLPILIQILTTKLNIYLVGPAGAGKTYAAIQCAKALDVPFYFTGAIASEFKLTGFIDAQGRIVSTEFRKAYENGGLFLFDEIDASYPQAVLAFNAALANDYMDFPDKRVQRHEMFYCIAAANTFGQGADRQYIGRNQLDAASLDRFVFLDWKYDENLERLLARNDQWSGYVQKVRKVIEENKIRHLVSPRASIFGGKLLEIGISRDVVETTILWKGLDRATINKIIEFVNSKITIKSPKEGTFSPAVNLNQTIKKGDDIGEIYYKDRNNNVLCDYITSPTNGVIVSILQNIDDRDIDIEIKKGQELCMIKSK